MKLPQEKNINFKSRPEETVQVYSMLRNLKCCNENFQVNEFYVKDDKFYFKIHDGAPHSGLFIHEGSQMYSINANSAFCRIRVYFTNEDDI